MDQRLFFIINHEWARPFLDRPMAVFSSWDFWWPILILAGLPIFVFGGFRARAAIVCAGLCVGITDGVIVDAIKDHVGRPRPNQVLEGVRSVDLAKAKPRFLALTKPLTVSYSRPSIYPVQGISFPSGHASNNFALATAIIAFYRRWGWLMLVPALLVSYSRIYVGSHYVSDTIVAIVIGIGVSLLVLALAEFLWRQFAPRLAPSLAVRHPSLLNG
jgi:undecaprenyl-diphosphatase